MRVNDFIGSLPKMMMIWDVFYDGQYRGTVRATSARKAYGFLPRSKFPDTTKIMLENQRLDTSDKK